MPFRGLTAVLAVAILLLLLTAGVAAVWGTSNRPLGRELVVAPPAPEGAYELYGRAPGVARRASANYSRTMFFLWAATALAVGVHVISRWVERRPVLARPDGAMISTFVFVAALTVVWLGATAT